MPTYIIIASGNSHQMFGVSLVKNKHDFAVKTAINYWELLQHYPGGI